MPVAALEPAPDFVESLFAAVALAPEQDKDIALARICTAVHANAGERVGCTRRQFEHVFPRVEVSHATMMARERGGNGLWCDAETSSDFHAGVAETAQGGDVAHSSGQLGENIIGTGRRAFFAIDQRKFGIHKVIKAAFFVPFIRLRAARKEREKT